MKLKTKLIIAFLTIVIVPTGLFYMALILLTSYQTKSIEKTYHISDVDDVFYGNSIQIFDRMTQAARTTIKTTIENTPDKLQDQPGVGPLGLSKGHLAHLRPFPPFLAFSYRS